MKILGWSGAENNRITSLLIACFFYPSPSWSDSWDQSVTGRITSPSSTVIGVGVPVPTATLDVSGSGKYSTTLGVGGLLTATGGISIPDGVSLSSSISFPRTMVGRSGTSLTIGDPDGWTHAGYRIYSGSHNFSIGGTNFFSVGNTLVSVTPPLTVTGLITASAGIRITGAGSGGVGRLYYDAGTDGLVLRGNTGGVHDFTLYSQNAGTLLANPTGSRNLQVGNTAGTTTLPGVVIMASTVDVTGGMLTVGSNTQNRSITLNGASGQNRSLFWKTAGSLRWEVKANSDAESQGTNAGSAWQLLAFDDAGAYIDNPISVSRAAGGQISLSRPVSIGSNLNVTGQIAAMGGALFNTSVGSAQGKIHRAAVEGLTIRGTPGSTNDFTLYSANAGTLVANPTGTRNLQVGHSSGTVTFPGAVTMTSQLTVSGELHTGTVVATNWRIEQAPDYVFEKGYDLAPLEEVESFIKKHKHLPDVPSAKEMKAQGLDLVKMNFDLLKKIEELTLHAIRQEKQMKRQEREMRRQAEKIQSLVMQRTSK